MVATSAVLSAAVPRAVAAPETGTLAAATESAEATRAAMRILRASGTAADAAIAAALVAGVSAPCSSGIGGGGFAVVWSSAERKAIALDFRETAPRGLDVEALERRPLPPAERGKLVGVPGEVKGLFELHRRFGKLPWAEVVAPAVETATLGYSVSIHLANTIVSNAVKLRPDGALTDFFVPRGQSVRAGARLENPHLARSLARLASEGPRAIYEGDIAASVLKTAALAGSAMTLADLSAYRPVDREPLHVEFRGRDVFTMPLPSAGGFLVAETLATADPKALRKLGASSGAHHHLLAEIFRGALADRMLFAGDPDFEHLDVSRLLDPVRLSARRRALSLERTRSLPAMAAEEHGTHHIVVADAHSNVVSLTTTVNNAFGAKLEDERTGIILNDQLDDFTARAAVGSLGLAESPNRARPGARPISSMTPTIVVKDGAPELAIGGSGGMAISVNVAEVLLARLVYGMSPEAAVAAPRFGVPLEGSTISLDAPIPREVWTDLERRGETVSERTTSHAVQLIAIDSRGRKTPAADQRKSGVALAE